MRKNMLKTPFVFVCLVFIIYMMRQNDITLSKGLRHSFRVLEERVLQSSTRPSLSLCDGVSFDETYSEGDIKRSEKFISNMEKLRGGNPLEDWVIDGNEDTFVDDYVIPLIPWIAPWPVLAIVSLLTCIGFVTNWCCIFGCCKNCCNCCKCCKPAKQQGRVKLYMAISFFFLLCMVGSAAAGLVFSPKVSKGINITFCSALISVENMVYGEPELKWLGFNGILASLYNIRTQFDNTVDQLSSIPDSQSGMNTAYNNALDANNNLYNNNNGKTDVPRADRTQGTYAPDYIANLGPATADKTYTYYIKQELDTWNTVITGAISGINTAVDELKNQKSVIRDAINQGIDSAESITSSLNDVIESLDDSGPAVKDGIKGAGYGLIALFAVNLLFSLVAILSIAMVGIAKVKFFSKILHFSWCVINLVTILGFLLSTLTLPASVVMMEACEIFRLTLNDQDFFETVTSKIFEGDSSDAQTILNTCFYGSGKALDELGITEQLSYFDTIYTELNSVNKIINLDGDYSTNPPPSIVIPPQLFLVRQFLNGELPDKDVTVTDLRTLNQGTNSDLHTCVNVKDLWMLNSINCTDSSYHVLQNSEGAAASVGSKTCIGFDEWMSPTTLDINNRYTPITFPATCTNPDSTRVKDLVGGFIDNRLKVQDYFGDVQTDLTTVSDRHRDYSNQVVSFITKIKGVRDGVSTLKDSIIGEQNGVIPNTNCQFVGTNLRSLQVSMCTGMMSTVYQAAIILIVMSMTALFATIFTFCLAKKFSINKEDGSRRNGTEPNTESAFPFKTVTM